ncbi:MAG TPA: hypothetical protein VGV38_04310, partial [Pyrinomonadaceae bacterium]|nr:hypothetical protein [Pyrinomonadaceae bacterium]
RTATLLPHAKSDFYKATFNFALGVRGDSTQPPMRNRFHLHYGSFTYDGDSDWIQIPRGHDSLSRIKDLGRLGWTDVYDVPFLPALQVPYDGALMLSSRGGALVLSPEDTIVKAVAGHLYLVRVKDRETDLYAMFRIESLKPSEECHISWKVVPSPEQP